MLAAVVIPFTRLSLLKITPAPKKPMPVTILEAMRSGLTSLINLENVVNRKEPRQIRIMVRKPADLLRYSRSAPMIPPTATTRNSFNINSSAGGIVKVWKNEDSELIHSHWSDNCFMAGKYLNYESRVLSGEFTFG